MSMNEALLHQQIEFLQSELEEARKSEEILKQHNDSLMEALSKTDRCVLKDQTIEELEKANEQHTSELQQAKKHIKSLQNKLETQKSDFSIENRELSLQLKELQISSSISQQKWEQERSQLESEVLKLQSLLNKANAEKEKALTNLEFQIELKLKEALDQNETLKDKHDQELQFYAQQSDRTINEIKKMHQTENEHLKAEIHKLKSILNSDAKHACFEEAVIDAAQRFSVNQQELMQIWRFGGTLNHLHARLEEKERLLELREKEIRELTFAVESITLQKNRARVEYYGTLLELKQLKLEVSNGNQRQLMGDIKILIGKLIRAKQKINREDRCDKNHNRARKVTFRDSSEIGFYSMTPQGIHSGTTSFKYGVN